MWTKIGHIYGLCKFWCLFHVLLYPFPKLLENKHLNEPCIDLVQIREGANKNKHLDPVPKSIEPPEVCTKTNKTHIHSHGHSHSHSNGQSHIHRIQGTANITAIMKWLPIVQVNIYIYFNINIDVVTRWIIGILFHDGQKDGTDKQRDKRCD